MQELTTVKMSKFVRNIKKKETKRNVLFKKVIHQTFWLIGCGQ